MRDSHSSVRAAAIIAILCIATFEINVLQVNSLLSTPTFSSAPISVNLLEDLAKKIELNDDYIKHIRPHVKSVSVGIGEPWIVLSEEELKQLGKDGLFDSTRAIESEQSIHNMQRIHEQFPLYRLQYEFELTSLLNKKLIIDPALLIEQADAEFDEILKNSQLKDGNEFSPLQFVSILHTTCVNIALKLNSGLSKETLLRRISFSISSPEVDESLNTRKLQSLDSSVDHIDSSVSFNVMNLNSRFHVSRFNDVMHHPLPGGVSFAQMKTGTTALGTGTLGGILIDGRQQRYTLTNHHVGGKEGTISCQPSQKSWKYINFNCYGLCCPDANQISISIANSTGIHMDWSVGKLNHSKVTAECRIEGIGYIAGAEGVTNSSKVELFKKHGSRTHLTYGFQDSIIGNRVYFHSRASAWPLFIDGNPQEVPAPIGRTYPGKQPFQRKATVPKNENNWFAEAKQEAIGYIQRLANYTEYQAKQVFENLYELGRTSLISDGGDSGSWYVSEAQTSTPNQQWNVRVLHDAGVWRHETCVSKGWKDPQGRNWCYLYKLGIGNNITDVLASINLRLADRINSNPAIAPSDRATVLAARTVRVCTKADGVQQNVTAQVGPPALAGSDDWNWP